jgi:2-isopropylmalate synthase
VYTSFSGSHQDAIKKGMYQRQRDGDEVWDVPYLPIDPKDVGRTYEAIIRVNSQSGKGGVAYLLLTRHGLDLPRGLQIEFAQKVQAITDAEGGEVSVEALYELFRQNYLEITEPYHLSSYKHEASDAGDRLEAVMRVGTEERVIEGHGNGPIAALTQGLSERLGITVDVLDYHEHATGTGADATAAAYVEADVDGEVVWGVGIHTSIVTASLRAVVNAGNRAALARRERESITRAFDLAT